jgi:hypothetical protein
MYFQQKVARLLAEPDWRKRKRGENSAARSVQLSATYQAARTREAEDFAIREAAWRAAQERAGHYINAHMVLPDLAQVEGWSKASGKEPRDPGRALFGGCRLKDW